MTLYEMMGSGFGILVIIMSIFQIAPIKINPWSWLAKRIGKAINGEIITKVDKLGDDLNSLRDECDKRDADLCRARILRFNDELVHDEHHTKEHFDQILLDITSYENYCDAHEHYKNNIAVMAIEQIKDTYEQCSKKGTFL